MSEEGIGSEDTVAAPSEKPVPAGQATKRESDPIVAKAAGSVTRASSPSLERTASTSHPDDYEDLLPVDPAHYKVVRELARGGMGRILEVRDRRLGRNVAIKEVLVADEAGLARFEREVAITARLQHPAIVHVHEAGRWPDGKPFYVMKLIRGKPLDARIAKAKSLAERLELLSAVITVVDALAYAHSQQVIHRDLKPANVLVGDFGETIVIDWGIAKAIGDAYDPVSLQPDRAQQTETIAGSVIGTPSYMPPEQAAGERVDARADVYSLGALLYQVLAGTPPFVGRTTAEVLTKVLYGQPPKLAEIDPDIPADLIAIVEKAMAREPADRFPTANEMVIELKRFQQGKLIASRSYTKWELAKRWLYRYRAAVGVAVIAMAALAVATVVYIVQIREQAARADEEARIATIKADEGHIALASKAIDRDPTETLARLDQLSRGSMKWEPARTIAADVASRGYSEELTGESGHPIYLLTFSPNGKFLADHGKTGNVRIWDLATRTSEIYFPAGKMFSIAFENDETLIGVDFDNNVWRWKRGQPEGSRVRKLAGEINSAAFSPDGKRLAVFGYRDEARVIDIATGDERPFGHYSKGTWTLDGKLLLIVDRRGGHVATMDAAGKITDLGVRGSGAHLAGVDSSRIWTAFYNYRQRHSSLSDLRGREFAIPSSENELVTDLYALHSGWFAASGTAMTASNDSLVADRKGSLLRIDPAKLINTAHLVRVFPTIRSEPILLRGHRANVDAISSTPDGKLATADERGAIRLWRLPALGHVPTQFGAVNGAFLTHDRRQVVVARRGPSFSVHDLFGGRTRILALENPPADEIAGRADIATRWEDRVIAETIENAPTLEIIDLVKPRQGRRFATLDEKKRVALWDLERGSGHNIVVDNATQVAISPDGNILATKSDVGLQLWDIATEKVIAGFTGLGEINALAVANDKRLLIAFREGDVYTIDSNKKDKQLLSSGNHSVRVAALSPDGAIGIVAGDDGLLWKIDFPDGGQPRSLIGHRGTVVALQFSDDGRFVASAAGDNDVRVWSLATGTSVSCPGHESFASALEFYGTETIVSSSYDRTARICDVRTGTSRALRGAMAQVMFAGHVAGGARVVVVDRFGGIVEHPDNLPVGEPLLRVWLDSVTKILK